MWMGECYFLHRLTRIVLDKIQRAVKRFSSSSFSKLLVICCHFYNVFVTFEIWIIVVTGTNFDYWMHIKTAIHVIAWCCVVTQHGACVNVADLWKFTPLHEAAAKGKFEICRLLLKVSTAMCSSNNWIWKTDTLPVKWLFATGCYDNVWTVYGFIFDLYY